MPGNLQPLDQKFAIVDNQGRPTEYFIRWAQQKQIDIVDSITLTDLQDFLTAHKLVEGSGIQFTPDGDINHSPTIAADVQEILDQITSTRGAILYRGLGGWAALLPGTSGFFLKTNGAGADPAWAAGGGGGGLPTLTAGTDVDLAIDPGAGGTAVVTINLAASAAVRTYLVNGFVTFTGAHAIDAVITLDTTLKHNTLRYADGGDRTTWIHCGPIVVTVPGDNATHTLNIQCADVAALGSITITDRWITAQQLT